MAFHVDDYQIRWKNFRAFHDTGWVTIRPLTILLGSNNAGKTSVLAPLLLMSQTVSSPDAATPLITRGSLTDLGTFQDVITDRQLSKSVFLGFKFHLHHSTGKARKIGEEPPGAMEAVFGAGKHPEEAVLKKLSLYDAFSRPLFTRTRQRSESYDLKSTYLGRMRAVERNLLRHELPFNFTFTPTTALRAARLDAKELAPSRYSPAFAQYLSAVGFAASEIGNIFGNLAYVGPLRERPKRHYEISGSIPASVGSRGENMANMIRRHGSDIRTRLNRWIGRFEFGSGLSVVDDHSGVFSLHFRQRDKKINIADAGFGASQVLPLIVQALTARKGILTVAEQPEIHLNPRLQSTLADLFVEMANSDHRVIVETHSEHLLLRLRRLIARNEIDHKKVALYFVEKVGGESKIREIAIAPDGSIAPAEWPKGFFDDSLRESLALAQEQFHVSKKSTRAVQK